jgi:membrane protein implicated in regulation of membrane protease activity
MTIYLVCLVLGVVFALFSLVFAHFLGGHDGSVGAGGHADSGFNADGVPGIGFFSPTILASFITAFGAFGLVFTEIPVTSSVWVSAPLSFVGGLLVALVVLWLFNFMFRKTESSSEGNVAKLVGQSAAVVSPIPENGVGEISYIQSGSRYSAPARNEKPGAIANGKTVKITRIVGSQFFVEETTN